LVKLTLGIFLITFNYTASADGFRILLSNDDGIESPLIEFLKAELETISDVEVVVSAPLENQSGSSQASESGRLEVTRVEKNGEFFGVAVDGKPATAVRYGLRVLGKDDPFDLVVSGINRGANVGNVSHLSGTVGAAMEGLYNGIPAIAVSGAFPTTNEGAAADVVKQLIAHYRDSGAPKGTVISVNVPGGELKGVVARPMGESYIASAGYDVIETVGDTTVYDAKRRIAEATDSINDTYAYQQGYITLTPLKFDWTDYEMLDELDDWGIGLE
jgi:5'-nucleotidase